MWTTGALARVVRASDTDRLDTTRHSLPSLVLLDLGSFIKVLYEFGHLVVLFLLEGTQGTFGTGGAS